MEHLVRELMIKMEFQNCQMKVLTKRVSVINTEKSLNQTRAQHNSNGFNSINRKNSFSFSKKPSCNQYVLEILCTKQSVIFYMCLNRV